MNNRKNLEELILHAETLEGHAREARARVLVRIRSEDPELAASLDDLFPTILDQGDWLFRALFRRQERPIDLYVVGHTSEMKDILGKLVHGAIS